MLQFNKITTKNKKIATKRIEAERKNGISEIFEIPNTWDINCKTTYQITNGRNNK